MVQLCEGEKDENFADYEAGMHGTEDEVKLASEKYQYWLKNGKRRKLLDQDALQDTTLADSVFLKSNTDVRWIYEVKNDKFGAASEVFGEMAAKETRLDRLTTVRSLEKLALVAAGFDADDGDAEAATVAGNREADVTEALKLINFQADLPGAGESDRPLSAAELGQVACHVCILCLCFGEKGGEAADDVTLNRGPCIMSQNNRPKGFTGRESPNKILIICF